VPLRASTKRPQVPWAASGIAGAVGVYVLLLHEVYSEFVAPTFGYLGYSYRPPTLLALLLAILLLALLSAILPRRIDRPSSFVLWILYLVAIVPSVSMAQYVPLLEPLQGKYAGIGITICFAATIGLSGAARGVRRPLRMTVSPTSFWLVVAAFSVTVYGLAATTTGLRLDLVAFADVYDVREDYSSALAAGTGVLGYLLTAQANVINPAVILRGLAERRWLIVAGGVIGQIVLYSSTGFKSVILSIPAVLLCHLAFRHGRQIRGWILIAGAVMLIMVSLLVDAILDSLVMTSLFARRFLLTPGFLMSAYLSFFSNNDKALLGHSVLEGVTPYPYQFPPPRVIGAWVTGSPDIAMNANYLADGFANFGWLGAAAASVLLALYLRIADRVSIGLPTAMSAGILLMPAITLANSALLTAFLTHGLIVALLVLGLMPRVSVPTDMIPANRAGPSSRTAADARFALSSRVRADKLQGDQ
jgi:hypothetical protein